MSTSPVWFREYEKKPEFTLLPSQESGASGEEVEMQLEKLKGSEKKVDARPTVSSFAFSSLEQYQNDGIFSYESLEIKENFCDITDLQSSSEIVTAPTIYVPQTTKTNINTTTCSRANGGIHDLSEYEVPREPKVPLMPTSVSPSEPEPDFFPAPMPKSFQSARHPHKKQGYQNRTDSKILEKMLPGTSKDIMGDGAIDLINLKGELRLGPISPSVKGLKARRQEYTSIASPGLGTDTRHQQVSYAPPASRVDRKAEKPTQEASKFDLVKTVNLIREWFTIVSLFHLIGSEEAYKRIREKIDVLAGDSSAPDWQPTIEQKLVQLCRELSSKGEGVTQRPDADEVACTALDLKVAAYYQGKTSYDPSELMENPILPTVERFEPNKARQKIILMRLDKV